MLMNFCHLLIRTLGPWVVTYAITSNLWGTFANYYAARAALTNDHQGNGFGTWFGTDLICKHPNNWSRPWDWVQNQVHLRNTQRIHPDMFRSKPARTILSVRDNKTNSGALIPSPRPDGKRKWSIQFRNSTSISQIFACEILILE